jgi:hypothetical protein
LAQNPGHDLTGFNCNYSIRGNISNPRAKGKKLIRRRFSFDQQQVRPRFHVIYWANAADYLGGAVSIRIALHAAPPD